MRVCIRRPCAGGHIYLAPAPPSKIMASKVGNGARKLSLEDADGEKFLDHTASDFNILVTGRFCVGKSEPINATFLQNSERKAKVGSGEFKPCTRVVTIHTALMSMTSNSMYMIHRGFRMPLEQAMMTGATSL